MKEILVLFIIISFNVLLISGKELEFTRYYFRRKSTWGKAVNRAEWKCREEKCQHFELGLLKDICIRKCISPDCYQELYAWNELEEGERDIRWPSFKGCAADKLRRRNEARMYEI